MAYMHIENLYKAQEVLLFKKVWATEKIHGTSAWLSYKDGKIQYHSGQGKEEDFRALFDEPRIFQWLSENMGDKPVKLHGEHYGGKIQKMSHAYGTEHKFVLFDIKVDGKFLSFDNVLKTGEKLGLEVVHGVIVDATVTALDAQRDDVSVQAFRNGITERMP